MKPTNNCIDEVNRVNKTSVSFEAQPAGCTAPVLISSVIETCLEDEKWIVRGRGFEGCGEYFMEAVLDWLEQRFSFFRASREDCLGSLKLKVS